ncbi:MAG: HD domain-containing phosphohydrolase [Desulfopila sp.]
MGSGMKSYREEVLELHHHRVYYILLSGIIIMMLFSCLDYIMIPEMFYDFFFFRLIGAAFGLIFVYLNYRDTSKRYAFFTGLSGFISISLVMLCLIYFMGSVSSRYYVGLLITLTIYVAFAPITAYQTLSIGMVLAMLYAVTVIFTPTTNTTAILELFVNLFYLISMVFILATQSWADTRARRREYLLRVEENRVTDKLSQQAEMLEQEVAKRSREQLESEARYRLLFNQIADDIALISPNGDLLQANANFNTHFVTVDGNGSPPSPAPLSLTAIVPPTERIAVDYQLKSMVDSGKPIRNYPIQLIRKDGTYAETEVSASLLQRDRNIIGIILLIRDISTRKEMEQKLRTSLRIRKQTETSAILALAKLSEIRDTTSNNHLERIREYCRVLAMELSKNPDMRPFMSPDFIEDIYHASILHDIGKVALPDELDQKLADDPRQQEELIRRHTNAGGEVIKKMQEDSEGSSFLDMAKHIVYFHHEQWDGKGLPHGLKQRETPLSARIMALADSYEEITTASTDTGKMHEKAICYLSQQAGKKFDPLIVEAFLTRQRDFKAIAEKFLT